MTKMVFFIEPNIGLWMAPDKIGKLFMNRVTIDEDVKIEVLKVFELRVYHGKNLSPSYEKLNQKGIDLSLKKCTIFFSNICAVNGS